MHSLFLYAITYFFFHIALSLTHQNIKRAIQAQDFLFSLKVDGEYETSGGTNSFLHPIKLVVILRQSKYTFNIIVRSLISDV